MAIWVRWWIAIPCYFALAAFVFIASRLVYNLFFHPLRHYPGPLLARASRLYILYFEFKGIQHKKTKDLHDQYGDVVRVAPDELSYNSAQAWIDICGHRSRDRPGSFEKDRAFFGLSKRKGPHIIVANDDDHRRFRRLQSHAFSEKALLTQQDVIKVHLDKFIRQLRNRAANSSHLRTVEGHSGVVNVVRWLNCLMFDTIGDLAFGSSFNSLDAGGDRYMDVIFSLIKAGNYLRAARRFVPFVQQLLTIFWIPKKLLDDQKFLRKASDARVKERLEAGTERGDFMSYILRANDEKGMTRKEIESGAQIFIIAGSETTATVLAGALYLLLTCPEYLTKLTQGVRSSFKSEDDINMLSTANLPFLNAVLHESLRLYPPVPNTFPRETPQPGEMVCGKFVPAGATVGIHHWASYRSSRNFHLPDEFIPERWLGDERFKDDRRDAFQPFSYGPRNCIGQNLAFAEMRLTMSRIIWNFDLELQDDSRNWLEEQRTFTLWQKEPLNIKFRAVKP